MSNQNITPTDDSKTLLELLKLMNFKQNRVFDCLNPSKELFIEVRRHCLHLLLCILSGSVSDNNEAESKNTSIIQAQSGFKACIMPQNNGKIVASILKRRSWWKTVKNRTDYNFIWTPLLKKGIILV